MAVMVQVCQVAARHLHIRTAKDICMVLLCTLFLMIVGAAGFSVGVTKLVNRFNGR